MTTVHQNKSNSGQRIMPQTAIATICKTKYCTLVLSIFFIKSPYYNYTTKNFTISTSPNQPGSLDFYITLTLSAIPFSSQSFKNSSTVASSG